MLRTYLHVFRDEIERLRETMRPVEYNVHSRPEYTKSQLEALRKKEKRKLKKQLETR